MKTGVQITYNELKRLNSGSRRKDSKTHFGTFYEIINYKKKSLRLQQKKIVTKRPTR